MLSRARSKLFFALWCCLSIIALIVFAIFVVIFVNKYAEDKSVYTTQVVRDRSNASPLTVVLCNANLVKKSKALSGTRFHGLHDLNPSNLPASQGTQVVKDFREVLRNTKLGQFIEDRGRNTRNDTVYQALAAIQEEFKLHSGMFNDSDWAYVAGSNLGLNVETLSEALRLTKADILSFGHRMDEGLLQCMKNRRACANNEISYQVYRDLGQCAVINLSMDESWFDTFAATIDLQHHEYITSASPSPGIRVFLSSSLMPLQLTAASPHWVAEPGKGTRFIIKKGKEIRRRTKSCGKTRNNSPSECLAQCLESQVQELCGCSLSLDSSLDDRCKVNQQYQFTCYKILEHLINRQELTCDCKLPCKEDFIYIDASPFTWLSDVTQDQVIASLERSGLTTNETHIRESLTKIEIVWSHDNYETLTEEEEISLLQLLLNIGAISALTAGISVLTGVELVCLFGKAILSTFCSVMPLRKDEENQVHILEPRPYNHFMRGESKEWMAYTGDGPIHTISDTSKGGGVNEEGFQLGPHKVGFGRQEISTDPTSLGAGRLNPVFETSAEFADDAYYDDDPEKGMNNEVELFAHPWERTGDRRPHRRILMVPKELGATLSSALPMFNTPNTSACPTQQSEDQTPNHSNIPRSGNVPPKLYVVSRTSTSIDEDLRLPNLPENSDHSSDSENSPEYIPDFSPKSRPVRPFLKDIEKLRIKTPPSGRENTRESHEKEELSRKSPLRKRDQTASNSLGQLASSLEATLVQTEDPFPSISDEEDRDPGDDKLKQTVNENTQQRHPQRQHPRNNESGRIWFSRSDPTKVNPANRNEGVPFNQSAGAIHGRPRSQPIQAWRQPRDFRNGWKESQSKFGPRHPSRPYHGRLPVGRPQHYANWNGKTGWTQLNGKAFHQQERY